MNPVYQKVEVGREESIIAFRYDKKEFEAPWHFHPQLELNYIIESCGSLFVGDFAGTYQPGQLVLLNANVPHFWKNQVSEEDRSQSLVVQWEDGVIPHIPEFVKVRNMIVKANKGIRFDQDDTMHVVKKIKGLLHLTGPTICIKFLDLMVDLSESRYTTLSTTPVFIQTAKFHNRIARIQEFIAQSFHRKIYLKEASDLVGMTTHAFARFFKRVMGRSFVQYLNEYRINEANRLLVMTDEPVSQIAYKCGYESITLFYRHFKVYKSTSPAAYRRCHRD